MILSDMHTHTGFSDDCNYPVDVMLDAAIAKGMKTVAITDHYDPGYPDFEFPFDIDFKSYHNALDKAVADYKGRLEVLKGLEIGIMEGQFDAADRAISAFPYDVVIGSFHCFREIDLYSFDYSKIDGSRMAGEFYDYMLECLKTFDNYDFIGHFSILDRYMDELCDYTPYEDVIDEILSIIIRGDKGMEINTSHFKYGTGTWLPRESILKRYRELGGKILTFGSDTHDPEGYGYGFADAVEFAKSLGFKYHCIYRERTPVFYPL